MNKEELVHLAQLAREKTGSVTATSVRQVAVDSALAGEILHEQASTLGRLGRALEASLVELRAVAEELAAGRIEPEVARERDRVARADLLRLRWELQVVKEAMGLRQVRREIDRDWPVPPRLP